MLSSFPIHLWSNTIIYQLATTLNVIYLLHNLTILILLFRISSIVISFNLLLTRFSATRITRIKYAIFFKRESSSKRQPICLTSRHNMLHILHLRRCDNLAVFKEIFASKYEQQRLAAFVCDASPQSVPYSKLRSAPSYFMLVLMYVRMWMKNYIKYNLGKFYYSCG